MTTIQKGEIIALGVLISLPLVTWALQRWWSDISGPFQSRDDAERKIAKGCVLVLFLTALTYATLGTAACVLSGQMWLAAFCVTIGWWLWVGLAELERRYHLLEVLELGR